MVDGSDGGDKIKVYKDRGSAFIRCHYIESNIEHEKIHILQQDETISEGIFRDRYADGDTAIGSRYFRRSGREKDRWYRLYRDNRSGNIQYEDIIWGKHHRNYKFNPETLDWTNLLDE